MELINKDSLLAAIEKKINEVNPDNIEDWRYRLQRERDIEIMKNIISLIKALEVKEVNIDSMLHEYWELSPKISVDCLESVTMTKDEMLNFAKHFFELGLNVSNPITEKNIESFVKQVIDLYIEAGKYYDNVIKEERNRYRGSDLVIKLISGAIDPKELGIQYVLDKLKTQKEE